MYKERERKCKKGQKGEVDEGRVGGVKERRGLIYTSEVVCGWCVRKEIKEHRMWRRG